MASIRTSQRIMRRCPRCGSNRPKDIAEGRTRFRLFAYLVMGLFTCGLLWLFFPAFFYRETLAWCPDCETSFRV